VDRVLEMAIFARVVEANSFSGAAQRLGISKGSVSKHVAALERSLGARLLNRTTRRLSLTEIGRAFYEHCAHVVSEAEAAEVAVLRLRSAPRGALKLTTPVAFGRLHVAPAIPDFLARYPEMSVQMVMEDRVADLAKEGYDIAVRMLTTAPPNVVARRLAPVRWVVCAAPEYLERHGTPQTPRDLVRHNCLLYALPGVSPYWHFRSSTGNMRVRVTGNFSASGSLALREVVLRGLGIAWLPTFTVGQDIEHGTLRVLLPKHEARGPFGGAIYAVYLPTRQISPKVSAFIDFFLARYSPEPYWDLHVASRLAAAADDARLKRGRSRRVRDRSDAPRAPA
jgi:DNA-binding transcriptional LysR family regulator